MDMMNKIFRFNFGIVFVLILALPLLFTCSTKDVGPNTPPEIDIEEPPIAPQVVVGSVDYTQVDDYIGIVQAAVTAGQVTAEIQAALDTFTTLISAADLDSLIAIDSAKLNNITTEFAATGQFPQYITNILDKLTNWNYLALVSKSSVSGGGQGSTSQLLKILNNKLAKQAGPFEDCTDLVTVRYGEEIAAAKELRDAGKTAAAEQKTECVSGQPARLAQLNTAIVAFCTVAPQNICEALTATYNIIYLNDLASCDLLRLGTDQAFDDAYNQIVAALNVWRAEQNDLCHQSFGGN